TLSQAIRFASSSVLVAGDGAQRQEVPKLESWEACTRPRQKCTSPLVSGSWLIACPVHDISVGTKCFWQRGGTGERDHSASAFWFVALQPAISCRVERNDCGQRRRRLSG